MGMITDEAVRQAVYQHILKFTVCRLERAMPGSEGALGHLSLNALLNLLFLVRGEWGSIGDFVATQQALRALLGDDLLWDEPEKLTRAPIAEVVN